MKQPLKLGKEPPTVQDEHQTVSQLLLEESVVAKCDIQFALHHCPKTPHFLAYLLAMAREGHLCAYINGETLTPSLGKWDPLLISQAKTLACDAVIQDNNRYYLKRNYEVEQQFLKHKERLEKGAPSTCQAALPESLTSEQQSVICTVLSQPLTWISGGPGTGKTFTAASLIKAFSGSVIVAAPTGKAAANLRKKIPDIEITTLHSLLATRKIIGEDLIVIDEGSMVDAVTYAKIFSKIKSGARVAIFGDQDQLPPVSSGNFFADCVQENPCRLTKCLRTNLTSIVEMAAAVRRGEVIAYEPLTPNLPWEQATILTPLRQGLYGVNHLNQKIAGIAKASRIPIMIVENAPSLELFNGDVGWLEGDVASFEGKEIVKTRLPAYELAYVLSVHKSQGSEYDHVVILLPEGSERFGREMLYTAITRARKSVRVMAADGVLEKVVQNSHYRLSKNWVAVSSK